MRSNMFDYMDIFIQVVEKGSFSQAADFLQLHRPAVSKAIQQLEAELGVKLIHRTTRKLNVTAEGEEFYQRAKQMMGEFGDMMANFSPTLPPQGRLRIDIPLSLAHSLFIPALGDFTALYPDIEVVLLSSDKRTDLIASGVDCVVRLGELHDSGFIARRLGEIDLVTCAAPAYIAQHGMPQSLEDLHQHQAINFFSDHSREIMTWTFTVEGKIVTHRSDSVILVDNSDILLSCGLAGLGIIQATRMALAAHLVSGALVEILPQYPPQAKPISILYPDRRYLPSKVQAFISWFSERFASQ
ncbi:LysR family transcriptional regulator [Pantoea sp. EA-12]|uniref:LysR substrate-binding domain-containing protein n=1 Tax=Pantoea sp. EA-12 TaxID=3043303 RepID=UPI0024B600CD|nr:LysR family transcriptional regulator [Pantoea sp. EA-12]MDI9222470.1 LysR family transcriptional regulator [Pantoea sp. EA-12]